MPGTPSISVAIATYQGENYLLQQLESIARQKLLPLEVVITDDQSQDATVEIAKQFALTSPFPVHVHRNATRLGYGPNFLRAASLCRGDLIAYCDQDDIWLENKLNTCVQYFEDAEVQLVMHSAQIMSSDGKLGYLFPAFPSTRTIRWGRCNPLINHGESWDSGFCMLLRRTLLSRLPLDQRPERLLAHDSLTLFMGAVLGKVVTLKASLVYYRQHGKNVFGASDRVSGSRMRTARALPKYADVANAESDCSNYLFAAAGKVSPRDKARVEAWANKLAFRSKLHRYREQMYGGRIGLFARVRTYFTILLSGGYLLDQARNRLGPRAALKDLIMGVGGYR